MYLDKNGYTELIESMQTTVQSDDLTLITQ